MAKLTEEQKNANRIEKKRKELRAKALAAVGGPNSLFRDEAAEVTTEQAEWHIRQTKSLMVEHLHTSPASVLNFALDCLELNSIEHAARAALGDEVFDKLNAYCRHTYPSVGYWRGFWRKVLTGGRTEIGFVKVPAENKMGFTAAPAVVVEGGTMTVAEFDSAWPFRKELPTQEAETSDDVFNQFMTQLADGCRLAAAA